MKVYIIPTVENLLLVIMILGLLKSQFMQFDVGSVYEINDIEFLHPNFLLAC